MAYDKKDLSGLGRAFEDLIQQARNKQDLLVDSIQKVQHTPSDYMGPASYKKEVEVSALLRQKQHQANLMDSNIRANDARMQAINKQYGSEDIFGEHGPLSKNDQLIVDQMSVGEGMVVAQTAAAFHNLPQGRSQLNRDIVDYRSDLPSNKIIQSMQNKHNTQTERLRQRISGAALSSNLFSGIYKKANTAENRIAAVAQVRGGIFTSEIDKKTEALEDEFRTLNADRARYGDDNFDSIVSNPEGLEAQHVKKLQARESALTKQIGFQDVLKTTQSQMGMTTGQIMTDIQHRGDIANKRIGSNDMFGSMQQGKGSMAEAQHELIKTASEFTKAISEMNKAIDLGAGNVEELGQAAQKAADSYDAASDNERIVRRERQDRSNRIGGRLQLAGQGLGTLGNMYTYGTVTSDHTQMEIKTQMAQFSNKQYDDVNAAAAGDGGAIRRLFTNQYENAVTSGNKQGTHANIGAGTTMFGQFLGTMGNILKSDGTMDAISTGIQGAGGMFNQMTDLGRDNIAGRTKLTKAGLELQLNNEINKIPDFLVTQGLKHQRGMGLGTRGAGATGRQSLLDLSGNSDFITQMAEMGVSPDDMPAMFMQATGALGSDTGAVTSGLRKAAKFTQSGFFGSTDQALSSMGALAGVGGIDIADVLKDAVANGMDSSKNIQEMVSGIVGLSSASMLRGVDTTDAVSSVLNRSNAALGAAGFGVNQRNAMSQNAFKTINAMFKDDGLSIQNMQALGHLNEGFSNAIVRDKDTLMSLDVGEVAKIRGAKSANTLNDIFESMGIQYQATDENFDSLVGAIDKTYISKGTSGAGDYYALNDKSTMAAKEATDNRIKPGTDAYNKIAAKYNTTPTDMKTAKISMARNLGMTVEAFDATISGKEEATTIYEGDEALFDEYLNRNLSSQEKFIRHGAQNKSRQVNAINQKAADSGGYGGAADAMSEMFKNMKDVDFAKQAEVSASTMKIGSEAITLATGEAKSVIDKFKTNLSALIDQMQHGGGPKDYKGLAPGETGKDSKNSHVPANAYNTPGTSGVDGSDYNNFSEWMRK